jgi:uncharacterized protein (TIGR02217 family)
VARGATDGPGFSTNVVTLGSGSERRNIQWANARGEWNISTGIRTRAEMQAVIAHFYASIAIPSSTRGPTSSKKLLDMIQTTETLV